MDPEHEKEKFNVFKKEREAREEKKEEEKELKIVYAEKYQNHPQLLGSQSVILYES